MMRAQKVARVRLFLIGHGAINEIRPGAPLRPTSIL
jgi:hypothetical protein